MARIHSVVLVFAFAWSVALAPHARAQDPANDRLTLQGAFAPGRNLVFQTGSVYALRFRDAVDGVEYQIDVNHPDVRKGMIRVYERASDSFPLTVAGPTFRDAAGNAYLPFNLSFYSTLTQHYATPSSVVLEYQDSVPGSGVHRRRHTFRIQGRALSVEVLDLDQSLTYLGNYSGFYSGPTAGTEDPRLILMQGALATPIVLFQRDSAHFFLGCALDMFRSNACDWVMPEASSVVPGPSSIHFSMHTGSRYYPNSAGQLSAPLDETWTLAISREVEDVLLAPTQRPSPYRELLDHRTVVLLHEETTPWSRYRDHLLQWDAWGLDDIAAYCFAFWSSSAVDAPAPSNQGPDWYPAKDPANFGAFAATARALGVPLGVYTAFNALPSSAPAWVYDASHIARNSAGQAKLSAQFSSVPLIAIGASAIHAAREATSLKQSYGLELAYLDIQSYASPSKGADGDHVDQWASSPWAATLREAFVDQKNWMRACQDVHEGPLLGEGSIATQGSNTEWLWAGYCDSVQRVVNTGRGMPAHQLAAGDPRAPTQWPVIPEFELRVMAPLQANHGNGAYDRFFSRSDVGMVNASTGKPIYPLSEAALDRYRIYELTYGHAAFFISSGPYAVPGNTLYLPDMVKEHYLVRPLQARYLDAPVSSIEYEHQGALKSFEQILFATETTDSFRDPRLHIAYENGLELYLNHAASSWSVTVGGVPYTLPEDGFVAHQPGTAFLAFSAIAPGTGGNRIDYCYAPGEHELFDGRGVVSGYGGVDTGPVRRLEVHNFVRGRTIRETSTGALETVQGAVPNVVSLEIEGSARVAAGERMPLEAIARFDNGAFRDVTTLVSWSSSNPAVARVNQGGAVIASSPGQALISTTSFQGATPAPLPVTVY